MPFEPIVPLALLSTVICSAITFFVGFHLGRQS